VADRWIDGGIAALRPSACQVKSTREETVLLFGSPEKLERRIILNPAMAKELAAGLAAVMREYDAQLNATPAGAGTSAVGEADVPPAARPLLAAARRLASRFGFEKSFKMSAGGLAGERVIFGLRARELDPAALQEACRSLGMPAGLMPQMAEGLGEANTIGFGFEGDAEGGVYKLYLEFWDRLRQRLAADPRNVAPALLFLGLKWPASGAGPFAVARYTCHPLLSVRGILARLQALYDARRDAPSFAAARAILELAARRIGSDSFVYVEAAEEGNPRASFDLNLYKARLRLADLRPILDSLGRAYALDPARLEEIVQDNAERPFGHLSGGLGRRGEDFLTAYYEIEGL
jgi:hypothetical protein